MTTNKKIALITGGNKGLGFEIARQLGQQNITVLITSRDKKKGEEAINELKKESIDAHLVTMDVTDETSIHQARLSVEKEFGILDILINNAGIGSKPTIQMYLVRLLPFSNFYRSLKNQRQEES
jgi:NAD(P)-dependent dehydrogenase (short-subunit alcohol dehydrogenase family)